MAAINITGTLQTSAGTGVEGAVVRVTPAPFDTSTGEAFGGVGLVLTPIEYLTDATGAFSVPVLSGFRFMLEIPNIGFRRVFVAPTTDVRFDLLGLVPLIESVADYVDSDGVAHNVIELKALPIGSVLERFDSIEIEEAPTKDGVYALVDVIALEDVTVYKTEIDAANTVYYRARYTHATNGESEYSLPHASDTFDEELLISVSELIRDYLFGVNLTNPDNGEPYPPGMFEQYIRAATDWLSIELDIPLLARDIVGEQHDHYATDYARWGFFELDEYPVQRVDRVYFQYPSMVAAVDIDPDWIVLQDEGRSGHLNIVPGQGSINDVLLMPGALFPMWTGATGTVPGVWRFDYRAGFEPKTLPASIKHILAMAASIGVLNIAGDLIAGAGIASLSVSVPGLSQSIGTTSSATNAGYGSRILEYQKEIKAQLPVIRRYYKGVRLAVI